MGGSKQKWTGEEELALRQGVTKYGKGKWRAIQKDPELGAILANRSNIDLKDKWRNLNIKAPGARRPADQTDSQDCCAEYADVHEYVQSAAAGTVPATADAACWPSHCAGGAPNGTAAACEQQEAQRHAVIDFVLRAVGYYCEEEDRATAGSSEAEDRSSSPAADAGHTHHHADNLVLTGEPKLRPDPLRALGENAVGAADHPEGDTSSHGSGQPQRHPYRSKRRRSAADTTATAQQQEQHEEADSQAASVSLAGIEELAKLVTAEHSAACAGIDNIDHALPQQQPSCQQPLPASVDVGAGFPPEAKRRRSLSPVAVTARKKGGGGSSPSAEDMVIAAIACMHQPNGSQLDDVYNWIEAHYTVGSPFRRTVVSTLRRLSHQGRLSSSSVAAADACLYKLTGVEQEEGGMEEGLGKGAAQQQQQGAVDGTVGGAEQRAASAAAAAVAQHSEGEDGEHCAVTCSLGGCCSNLTGTVRRRQCHHHRHRSAVCEAELAAECAAAQLTSHVMQAVGACRSAGHGSAPHHWHCVSAAIYGGYE